MWPWLAQLGQGRGGLYSYDFLENLIGCDIHSADRILPEHQKLRVGDRISLDARISDSYRVLAVEPGRVLVLAVGDADTRSSWTFFLEERGDEATRLLVRSRLTYPPTFGQWFVWRAVTEPLHVVMQEKMLRGIRDRAERAHRTLTPGDFVPGPHVAELAPETHAPR